MQLDERMKVTRDLIWQVNTYQDILEYLSYDLHDSASPISQNEGLFFVWHSLMGLQILALSKLIKDDGAFSLKKLINMGGAKVKGFDKSGLLEDFDYIHSEYQRHKLDSVRDQFIAHLDMSDDEIKTDIHMLCVAKNQVTSLYDRISLATGGEEYQHDERCVKGIRGLFDEIDEYEKIKAIIVAAQIKGLKQVNVSDFLAIKC
ncbi:hypothetical protein IMCC21906_01347 [Spongiibacter sp. IMCC21906]|nr:hypothetical protein IMCC21906_01347 [Spongiibacter sp. IMCC21906]